MAQYSLTLDGVTPHERALLSFSTAIESIGAENIEVAAAGTSYWRRDWVKSRIVVDAEGWTPPDFSSVDFPGPMTLSLTTLSSVDGDGNSTWGSQDFTVYCEPPVVTGRLDNGRFTWRLTALEAAATVSTPRDITFSLGGVVPPDTAKFTLETTVQAVADGRVAVRKADGTLGVRQLYEKSAITVRGSGWTVPAFGALDFTGTLTLVIGTDSYSVKAEPLRVEYDRIASTYSWTLVAEEV
jgi:hypothetical protein